MRCPQCGAQTYRNIGGNDVCPRCAYGSSSPNALMRQGSSQLERGNLEVASPVANRLVAADNDFGFRLLAELVKEDSNKNVFVSPSIVAIALAMTYNGAEGTTKQAMAETLAVEGMSLQEVNEGNAALRTALESPDPKVQLAIANSLWGQKDIVFKPDFMQRNTNYYGAKVASLDFSDPNALPTINGWVKEQTNGKIDELVNEGDLVGAVLVLINAIHFKGMWRLQFDEGKTKEGPFTLPDGKQKQHPMMQQSGAYRYYEDKNFQALSLPYGEGRISMYIFLPARTVTLGQFQKELNTKNWEKWMSQFHEMGGDITLPRFKVEYEAVLAEALTALGMGVAFGGGANLHGICTGGAFISAVRHKTFVEVNEEGTEAAAAIAVSIAGEAIVHRFSMTVDRPFFCAICDSKTGAILFMGFIVEPS